MINKKFFREKLAKFFTKKIVIAIILASVVFILFNINNVFSNLKTHTVNKQKFFKNLIFSILIYLVIITLLLLLKLIIERIKNITGSKIRFKLTLLFIFVAFIPAVILTISSSYLINEAMNRTILNENTVKPLEKSLNYYRENLSASVIKVSNKIIKSAKSINYTFIPKIISKLNLSKVNLVLIFKLDKNNQQILFSYNKTKFNRSKLNFYQEYFEQEEFSDPIIHKLNENKWIIFIIKSIKKTDKTFLLTGKILSKKKIAIAQGINAILERYSSLKIIASSLIRDFQLFILLISLPVVLLAVIIGFYLASEITKPLSSLVDGTIKIVQGVYGFQIKEKANDELGQLIEAFNTMSHELYLNKNRLFEAEKLAAWREVAKKLAHEVKNPLTPIKLASERLLRAYNKDSDKFENILNSCSKTISKEVDRLKDLVNEFSQFARFPMTNFKDENIVEIMNDLAMIYNEANDEISINYTNKLKKDEIIINIDKNQIKQVIINLIENAIEADTTKIKLKTSSLEKDKRNFLQISVCDNGLGIPEKNQTSIFAPYFSSKKRGSGLGLSIVKNIIEEHKGIIYFKTKENKGTTFYIEIPYYIWRKDDKRQYSGN